jgi:hypothetical protein
LLDELAREAGARGVVHEDPIVLRDLLLERDQRVQHALGAARPTREERLYLFRKRAPVVLAPVAVERREHDVDALDARNRGERRDRMEHHRLAADRDVLLGDRLADARALAGGGDDGEDLGHRWAGSISFR